MKQFVVHTPTRKMHDAILKYMDEQMVHYNKSQHNHNYGDEHCIDPIGGFYSPRAFYREEGYDIISTETFFAILGREFKASEMVKLNDSYVAEVFHDTKIVSVGCQNIPFSAIENLYKVIQQS